MKTAAAAAAESPGDGAPVASRLTAIEVCAIVVAVLAVIAAAKVAQPLLVPVVAAILLSYTLRPLVSGLERLAVPRVACAAIVVAVLVALVGAIVVAIKDDVNDAVAELPVAARKLRRAAVQAAQQSPGPIAHVKEAAAELDRAAAEAAGKPASGPAPTPPAGVAAQIQAFVAEQSGQALAVLAQVGIVLLLAFFLLAAGDTFRRKVARLAGASLSRRRVTVEVLDEIDAQVQGYMITLLIANVLIAVATWGALALLGVPNAGMWALATGVLHFVPYAGTALAAGAVGVAAFLDSASIPAAMAAGGAVVAIAIAIGMGLFTWLQGRAARMHPVAVFVGVLFFGWLWGGWGLLLGMPILAVLKSIADRVGTMQPVSELLRE